MKQFKGLFPALLTPYDGGNRVNESALRALVRLNLDKGVDGFYVGGSSAEAFLLTQEERKRIFEVVLDEVSGKKTVICHIGCVGTDQTLDLGRFAKNAGADAVSSVAPFYYGFSFDEILGHYRSIADEIGLPVVLYNFPAASGVTLSPENAAPLLRDERFIGVKHTSSDYFALERFKKIYPRLVVYNGYDETFLAGLAMGADGGIGSTYNFMAEKFIEIKRLFDAGDLAGARRMQSRVNDVIAMLLKVGVLPGCKEILRRMGIDCGGCRRPFHTLSEEEKRRIDGVMPLLSD